MVNKLPKQEANHWLVRFADRNRTKLLSTDVINRWYIEVQDNNLIDNYGDMLESYLSQQESSTDETYWMIYVTFYKKNASKAFSWSAYLNRLPRYKKTDSKYGKYYGIVKTLGYIKNTSLVNGHNRIGICSDIAELEYRGRHVEGKAKDILKRVDKNDNKLIKYILSLMPVPVQENKPKMKESLPQRRKTKPPDDFEQHQNIKTQFPKTRQEHTKKKTPQIRNTFKHIQNLVAKPARKNKLEMQHPFYQGRKKEKTPSFTTEKNNTDIPKENDKSNVVFKFVTVVILLFAIIYNLNSLLYHQNASFLVIFSFFAACSLLFFMLIYIFIDMWL